MANKAIEYSQLIVTLGTALATQYKSAEAKEKVLSVYLFGIRYHKELGIVGVGPVLNEAIQQGSKFKFYSQHLKPAYKTELVKAMNLGRYVKLKKAI